MSDKLQVARTSLLSPLFVVFLLNLTACATGPDRNVSDFDQRATQINFEMTKNQAQEIMGLPKNRQFSGSQEALQWCETSHTRGTADSYLVVNVYNGQVIGLNTYRGSYQGYCESFFSPIEWIKEPEKVIELRTRRLN